MFLFRDHINMLTDLGRDWSSGPPHDFNTYIPMIYGVNLGLSEFELNLFANDHNVVDKPLSRDDNGAYMLWNLLLFCLYSGFSRLFISYV